MQRGLELLFLFLSILLCSLSVFAATETFTLNVDSSKLIKDVNITLLRTNTDTNKVILCVNNRKVIVKNRVNVDNSLIRLKDVSERFADFEVEVTCTGDCECSDNCLNTACFSSSKSCSSDADCDDSNPDTTDLCIAGACENRAAQLKSCSLDSECDDKDPCTADECNKLIKKCVHNELDDCVPPVEEPLPIPEQPTPTTKSIPLYKLATYILLGLAVLLLIAVVVKKAIK